MIRLTIDTSRMTRRVKDVPKQIRFAAAGALNDSINDAQRAIRRSLPDHFTLRQTSFIERTIYRTPRADFATRTQLLATVRVDPRRDILAKFERGGQKVALSGKPFVAIPARDIRRTKRQLIRKSDLLSRFRPFRDISGDRALGQARSFILPVASGARLLLQRVSRRRTRALWYFRPSVQIPPDLHFHQVADRSVRGSFNRYFHKRFLDALRTAR